MLLSGMWRVWRAEEAEEAEQSSQGRGIRGPELVRGSVYTESGEQRLEEKQSGGRVDSPVERQ